MIETSNKFIKEIYQEYNQYLSLYSGEPDVVYLGLKQWRALCFEFKSEWLQINYKSPSREMKLFGMDVISVNEQDYINFGPAPINKARGE